MDLCTLEDAFPNIETGTKTKRNRDSGFPFVGGTDNKPTREERRAARKLAKRAKGPQELYSDSLEGTLPDEKTMEVGGSNYASYNEVPDPPRTEWKIAPDPDRPAVIRMPGVDEMGKEGFRVHGPGANLPTLPKASCLFSDTGTPAYFGRSVDDEDTFMNFTPSIQDDAQYRLYPDFTQSDQLKGISKAASQTLPEPPSDDTWKPMTPAASYTAFVKGDSNGPDPLAKVDKDWPLHSIENETVGANQPVGVINTLTTNAPPPDNDGVNIKMQHLIGRLEELEKQRRQDSQTEILMFVGTGLFLLVSFELMRRR
jgi:hypothetical protein